MGGKAKKKLKRGAKEVVEVVDLRDLGKQGSRAAHVRPNGAVLNVQEGEQSAHVRPSGALLNVQEGEQTVASLGEQGLQVRPVEEEVVMPRVAFRDLRRESLKMKSGEVFELERDLFVAMVRENKLLCFNETAYWECHAQKAPVAPAVDVPDVWFPYMRPEPCKKFVLTGTVFVDEMSRRYENLVIAYLQEPGSSRSAERAFSKSLSSLRSFGLARSDQGRAWASKDATDDSGLDDQWQHVVSSSGKSLTTKELLVLIMKRQDAKMENLSAQLTKVEASLSRRVNDMNASLSLVAEPAFRSNFGLFNLGGN